MRSEQEWTRWGDEHPILSALMQLGIYALCCIGALAGLAVLVFLAIVVSKAFGGGATLA